MRFALLGDHPDGLVMARALSASGRHEITVYSGPAAGLDVLARDGLLPRRVGDLEEALADPAIEAVIVAGGPAQRPGQLRRALQSEHHVLCVHPIDPSADIGYEAALLQSDVQRVLFPLMPEALHPAITRFADLTSTSFEPLPTDEPLTSASQLPPGAPRLLTWERWSNEECLFHAADDEHKPGLPGWDVLRLLGGEIAEVFAMTMPDELAAGEPLAISGRFVHAGLWQMTLLPWQAQPHWQITAITRQGRTELTFPHGWPGPARLSYTDEHGQPHVEEWPALNPWTVVVEAFDLAVDEWRARRHAPQPGEQDQTSLTADVPRLGWLDAIRSLELDDAVRRSVERRRAYSMDFPEATEEASFKGAMTLVGCSLLWLSLLLLILSIWVPALGWAILPVFGVFLVMQVLRWAVPRESGGSRQEQEAGMMKRDERKTRNREANPPNPV